MRRYTVTWIENGREEMRGFAFEDGALTRFIGMASQARAGRGVSCVNLRYLGPDGEQEPTPSPPLSQDQLPPSPPS